MRSSRVERVLRPIEPALCHRAGVVDVGFAQVMRGWARAICAIAAYLATAVVIDQMIAALVGTGVGHFAVSAADWWAMAGAIALVGAFVAGLGSDPDGPGVVEPEHLVVALHWVIVGLVWWLGVTSSPIMEGPQAARMYYPLATAIAALATAQLLWRFAHSGGWDELPWLPDLHSDRSTGLFSIQPSILAVLAVLFTRGEISAATATSALIAAIALGLVALRTEWNAAAFAGSLSWELASGTAGLLLATQLDRSRFEPRSIYAAAGVLAAAFLLWKLAGILRKEGSDAKRRISLISDSSECEPTSPGQDARVGCPPVDARRRRRHSDRGFAARSALGLGNNRRRRPAHGGRRAPGHAGATMETGVARLSGASDDPGGVC